ncbi:hypothetical protein H920_17861 [Fukomys damarensis]|uniref:Uncharacterized protein n=1 Tax=Fukomys damarensis TaxID=885580 RepID=A0A091CTC0_FUKDA|nr:hypothetical protein H920_17861 [Fukomys damarensis]
MLQRGGVCMSATVTPDKQQKTHLGWRTPSGVYPRADRAEEAVLQVQESAAVSTQPQAGSFSELFPPSVWALRASATDSAQIAPGLLLGVSFGGSSADGGLIVGLLALLRALSPSPVVQGGEGALVYEAMCQSEDGQRSQCLPGVAADIRDWESGAASEDGRAGQRRWERVGATASRCQALTFLIPIMDVAKLKLVTVIVSHHGFGSVWLYEE